MLISAVHVSDLHTTRNSVMLALNSTRNQKGATSPAKSPQFCNHKDLTYTARPLCRRPCRLLCLTNCRARDLCDCETQTPVLCAALSMQVRKFPHSPEKRIFCYHHQLSPLTQTICQVFPLGMSIHQHEHHNERNPKTMNPFSPLQYLRFSIFLPKSIFHKVKRSFPYIPSQK